MYALYYTLLVFIGFVLAYLYGKNTTRFLWREYWAMLIAPATGIIWLAFIFGPTPVYIFIMGSLGGAALEWSMGFMIHKIIGAKLWVYNRYPLPGSYTSYLALPFWGIGMVLFWLILRNF